MNIKRGLKIAGLSLLAVLLILVASIWMVVGTQSGSQWALARLPGLQLENFQGRLGGQWSADRLLWLQGEDRVEVQALAFDWTPGCLLKMTLCI
ncbi:hypothetical protein, partial [Pseudomonas viridiflava]